ncbi:MAG: penicillin-binding protein [Oscillospiraceae bacterium]|nr:penicillin-binding protein [Oscillospiraceae bacterium]
MNKVAARAAALLVFVLILTGGLVFFLGEYIAGAEDWVMFAGSPHVYSGNKLGTGILTDREGELLTDLRSGRTYSEDALLRESMLHWTGDRLGNIHAPFMQTYAAQLLGFDPVNGLYSYGDSCGTVQLTLSAKAQKEALEAMGNKTGTVAVYNYKTGEILCAVTTPTYDPENVPDIAGDTAGKYTGVYMNRFVQSRYIPGSIFKIVTLAAALEATPGIEELEFTCSGTYEIGGGDITCMERHGKQTLKQAFRNSCNCAFAQVAEHVGREKLARYVALMGITDALSFDGVTTSAGNFEVADATPEQVAWSAIGQHKDQINPCAYLAFIGAVAGEGTGAMPYIVSQVTAGERTTYEVDVQKSDRVMTVETARVLREYMRNNVVDKYGAENFPDVEVCAKTGTAEVGGGKAPTATFAGFVADKDYPLAFIVVVEEGGYGRDACIPVASRVLKACMAAMDGI